MPCKPCGSKRWKLGSGPCMYRSLEACKRALKAYYAKQGKKGKQSKTQKKMEGNHYADKKATKATKEDIDKILDELSQASQDFEEETIADRNYIKELLDDNN